MRILRCLVAFVLLSTAFIAQDFEGYVKYKVESDRGETLNIKYYKKGDMVRMEPEIAQQKMSIIFRGNKTYMIMPEQGMYMEYDSKIFEQMDRMKMKEKTGDMKKPVKTGETKEILGYKTEKWIFEDDDYSAEVWASGDLGNFVALSMPMQRSNMPDWYSDVVDNNFFPLLIIAKDKDGSIKGRMEVVEINTGKLKNTLFEIPEGYKKLDMPMGDHQFGK